MRAAKTIKQLKNEFEKMHSVGRQRRVRGGEACGMVDYKAIEARVQMGGLRA